MLTLFGQQHRSCDGVSRRDVLRVGSLGLGGLSLTNLLQLKALGAVNPKSSHKAVIQIFLSGGPSHIDTYDMKPHLPVENRGEFKPIQTAVPGMDLCELMPQQAKMANKFALLRGVRTVGNHTGNEFYSGTAWEMGRDRAKGVIKPALGAIVSRLKDGTSAMPQYVSLQDSETWEQTGFAGQAHKPFRVFRTNVNNKEPLQNLGLCKGTSQGRLADRKALLNTFDRMRRDLENKEVLEGMDAIQARALDIVTSGKVRDAFDLKKEPEDIKRRYGTAKVRSSFVPGQDFLFARRLVEAGVSVVTICVPGWDTHQDNFKVLRQMLPVVDQAFCALLGDLEERGMLQDTTIIMGGEMGRTPRVESRNGGRNHWPQTGIALVAGGGLKTGQVVGASDAKGEQVLGRAITPQMLLATVYHALGIDPATTIPDASGRPQYLLDQRETIKELL